MRFRVPVLYICNVLVLQLSLIAVAQDDNAADDSVNGDIAASDSIIGEEPAHEEIRALRDGALQAYERKDIDELLTYLHPNVAVTVQNAETLRGHQGVREFHERMSVGDNSEVISIRSTFNVDELSMLYGDDTAVAVGSMNDELELRRGMKFSLQSRWTATMVKEDDKWLVSAFHVSTDMFDNGVSRVMLWWRSVWVGLIAAAIGALCGALIFPRFRRRSESPNVQS